MPRNEYDDLYQVDKKYLMDTEIETDKKSNMQYWDGIDESVEEFLIQFAANGGIKIKEFGELDLVKDTVEFLLEKIKERFPQANFPFVDEEY